MRIVLEHAPAAGMVVSLHEQDDFASFSVEIPPRFRPRPGASVGPVRFSTATQAWVDRAWLVGAGGFDSRDRRDALESMIAVADRLGWIDHETDEVAGHVVDGEMSNPKDGMRGADDGD